METIEVGSGNSSAVLVKLQSGHVGDSGCQQSIGYDFAFRTDKNGGDNTLSFVLDAYAATQRVKVMGDAQCARVQALGYIRSVKFD